MTSWKTTVGGLLSAIGASLYMVPDDAPGVAYLKPWAGFLAAVGATVVGISARDHKVTSEQALAKDEKAIQSIDPSGTRGHR